MKQKIEKAFANTLNIIEAAVNNNKTIDFDYFVSEQDDLCAIALNHGDIVPGHLIRDIDFSLSKISKSYENKYILAFESAVCLFKKNSGFYEQQYIEATRVNNEAFRAELLSTPKTENEDKSIPF